jgi:hypothetical protein
MENNITPDTRHCGIKIFISQNTVYKFVFQARDIKPKRRDKILSPWTRYIFI